MKKTFLFAGLMLASGLPGGVAMSQFLLDLETGRFYSGYNDVAVPGKIGTRISLSDELKADPGIFFRVRLGFTIHGRHTVSTLIAPLRIHSSGLGDRPVFFEGVTFPTGTKLESRFRFDSYRLTYRYDFLRKPNWTAGAGISAKIRDASISLKGAGLFSEKKNTGFVPLIHFRVLGDLTRRLGLFLEGDALGAPQGRAEDVLIAATFRPVHRVRLKLGYRILEGGANVEEVYNFTLIHYAVAGMILEW